MVEVCIIKTSGWSEWYKLIRTSNSTEVYIALILAACGLIMAFPLARIGFFILQHFINKKWRWTADMAMTLKQPTGWLMRIGLLWSALVVSRLDDFLCQWPLWVFGIPLLIWINAFSNVCIRVRFLYLMFEIFSYFMH